MSYKSLRDFIDKLESMDALVRVTEPVSTKLEMTEIQTRLLSEDGPAVLFENVIKTDGQKYSSNYYMETMKACSHIKCCTVNMSEKSKLAC